MRSAANKYQDKLQNGVIFVTSDTLFFTLFLQKKRLSESSKFRSNHNVSPYNHPFTFTGKERDSETGFSYFGARYYDSDLSGLFLSVDPMSDKYPNISPYAYCAWNPLKLVDPDGNEFSDIMEKYAKKIEAICQSKIDKLTELSKHEKLTEKQQDMLKEFQDTKNEIAAMRDDKTTFYDVQIASFGVGHENDKGITQYYGRGDITRKGKKQHLMMVSLNADKFSLTQKGELSYGGMLTLIHELKHCYQFYNKELFYLQPANGGDIITCDSEDIEKAAFKRGAAFGSVDRYNPALYKNHSKTMSKMIEDNPGCTIIKHK